MCLALQVENDSLPVQFASVLPAIKCQAPGLKYFAPDTIKINAGAPGFLTPQHLLFNSLVADLQGFVQQGKTLIELFLVDDQGGDYQ